MLKLGKLKLGMLGSPPQPERATQLSTEAIARRMIIVPPPSPLDLRPAGWLANWEILRFSVLVDGEPNDSAPG